MSNPGSNDSARDQNVPDNDQLDADQGLRSSSPTPAAARPSPPINYVLAAVNLFDGSQYNPQADSSMDSSTHSQDPCQPSPNILVVSPDPRQPSPDFPRLSPNLSQPSDGSSLMRNDDSRVGSPASSANDNQRVPVGGPMRTWSPTSGRGYATPEPPAIPMDETLIPAMTVPSRAMSLAAGEYGSSTDSGDTVTPTSQLGVLTLDQQVDNPDATARHPAPGPSSGTRSKRRHNTPATIAEEDDAATDAQDNPAATLRCTRCPAPMDPAFAASHGLCRRCLRNSGDSSFPLVPLIESSVAEASAAADSSSVSAPSSLNLASEGIRRVGEWLAQTSGMGITEMMDQDLQTDTTTAAEAVSDVNWGGTHGSITDTNMGSLTDLARSNDSDDSNDGACATYRTVSTVHGGQGLGASGSGGPVANIQPSPVANIQPSPVASGSGGFVASGPYGLVFSGPRPVPSAHRSPIPSRSAGPVASTPPSHVVSTPGGLVASGPYGLVPSGPVRTPNRNLPNQLSPQPARPTNFPSDLRSPDGRRAMLSNQRGSLGSGGVATASGSDSGVMTGESGDSTGGAFAGAIDSGASGHNSPGGGDASPRDTRNRISPYSRRTRTSRSSPIASPGEGGRSGKMKSPGGGNARVALVTYDIAEDVFDAMFSKRSTNLGNLLKNSSSLKAFKLANIDILEGSNQSPSSVNTTQSSRHNDDLSGCQNVCNTSKDSLGNSFEFSEEEDNS